MKEAEEVEQDVASDMLLALQNRTSISRDHPRQNSSAFPETSPPAPAHGPPREEDDESDEHAPTSAEEHDADTALTMDEDDLELKAAQTLSGLAQMEAQKLAAEKKERKNFTKETVDELKRWFASHLDHPYPDEDDKEELARQTGLNVAQVSSPPLWACTSPLPFLNCPSTRSCASLTRAPLPLMAHTSPRVATSSVRP